MNETWEFDSVISELYPLLQSEHPCWTVLIFASIFSILAFVGILLNFSVLYVTIRTRSLRGTANILLAVYSLCEIIHLCGNFVFTYTAFSGNYFIPFKSANRLALLPFYAFGFGMYLMLFTGIDRLLVVLFPLKKVNDQIFLAIALTISGLSGFGMTIYYLIYTDGQLNSIKVLGSYFEIIRISFKLPKCQNLVLMGYAIFMLIIIVYALIAVIIHYKKAPSNSNSAQINNRIFRSLFTIVFVNLGGYIISILFLSIFYSTIENPKALWNLSQIIGIFVGISSSSNGPILYFTSSEYRMAYRKEFTFFFKTFFSSSVAPRP